MRVAHLTTVDMSLRFLVFPQLAAVIEQGGTSYGISAPGPWVEEIEDSGVIHLPLTSSTRGMNIGADLAAARQLYRILKKTPVDILHTHNPKPGIYGRIVGKLAGVPIVVNTIHGLYATEDDRLAKRLIVYMLEAIAARFSDAELAQNIEDVELMSKYRITVPSKMKLLGNGVDLTRFDPETVGEAPRTRLLAEWEVGDDQIVVGIVGRLVAEKGYPELFEAMEQLDDRYVLVVAGPDDPSKDDALPRDMIERAEANGVRFLGMRDDVDELYSALDIFVLPSHREGFPRAAMEAAAMRLPIVATDIRGCRQVVTDDLNGYLVPVINPQALATSISRIGDDPSLMARLGEGSFDRSREEFDERRVVEIVMDTYRRVAREKGLSELVTPLPDKELDIRPATADEASVLAGLHAEIRTGFLPRLGSRFLTRLYRALIAWPGADVLVAHDGAAPLGFVASVDDTGRFYKHFLRRHGLPAVFLLLPKLVRPSILRRIWETFQYGTETQTVEVEAELFAIATSTESRGRGLGATLLEAAVERYRERGLDRVQVVVSTDNAASLAAHRRDRKSTRLNSSHTDISRMPSSA